MGEAEIGAMMGQMEQLLQNFNELHRERLGARANQVDIPRSMFVELEAWNPDEDGAISVASFFTVFEDVAGTLDQRQKIRLLRAKTRGKAKQFLIDNEPIIEGDTPYDDIKKAMLNWFEKDNPKKSSMLLCNARKQTGETLRQFAERLHRLAKSAVMHEGLELSPASKVSWIKRRVLEQFIQGVGKEVGNHLINNEPTTIEEALKRAEALQEREEPAEEVDLQWDLAAVSAQEDRRCFECGGVNHYAARCPRRMGRNTAQNTNLAPKIKPRYACMFCGELDHFPVHCAHNPQKTIFCDFCGLREHLESQCNKKKALTPVSHPRGNFIKTPEQPSEALVALPNENLGHLPIVKRTPAKTMRVNVQLNGEKRSLVVDTGAAVSVLKTPIKGTPVRPTNAVAWGADGYPLSFMGEQTVKMELAGIELEHTFLIFARDGAGIDLFGLDLMRKIPIALRTDRNEMIILETGKTLALPVFSVNAKTEETKTAFNREEIQKLVAEKEQKPKTEPGRGLWRNIPNQNKERNETKKGNTMQSSDENQEKRSTPVPENKEAEDVNKIQEPRLEENQEKIRREKVPEEEEDMALLNKQKREDHPEKISNIEENERPNKEVKNTKSVAALESQVSSDQELIFKNSGFYTTDVITEVEGYDHRELTPAENWNEMSTTSTEQFEEKLSHLNAEEKKVMTTLLKNNEQAFKKPGKEGCLMDVAHRIETGDSEPIKIHPYNVPHADGLSRVEVASVTIELPRKLLIAAQEIDPWIKQIAEKPDNSLVQKDRIWYKTVTVKGEEKQVPLIPPTLREYVLINCHSTSWAGHPGAEVTELMVRRAGFWPKICETVKEYIQQCVPCQQRNEPRKNQAPIQKPLIPSAAGEIVGIDFVGPLASGSGQKYLLTMVDHFTKYAEAYITKDTTAETVAKCLVERFIPVHGVPKRLVSDRGTAFTSKLIQDLCKKWNIKKIETTAYHPQGNGVCERFHRTFANIIAKIVKRTTQWERMIPIALAAYRSIPHASTGYSPNLLAFGREL